MSKQKIYGQVFTPVDTVELMLDLAGFVAHEKTLLRTKVMEPSFGEGVFLLGIIERVIKHAEIFNVSKNDVVEYFNENVHGVELDKELHKQCLNSLNELLKSYNYPALAWENLLNENTLTADLPNDYDLVIGNPPYVRVHNMDEKTRKIVKTFKYTGGSTDLYIAFMEKGLDLLSEDGKLVFITPNSFMKNTSQKKLRKHLVSEKRIDTLINYRSGKVFDNADTYVAISVFTQKTDNETFSYKTWDTDVEYNVELSYADLEPQYRAWNFGQDGQNIAAQNSKTCSISDIATVGYGIATLRDKIYIDLQAEDKGDGTTLFNGTLIETAALLPIVKISTYRGGDIKGRIIFPYMMVDGKARVLDEDFFEANYPLAYAYLESHRESLDKRAMESRTLWFQFGRSQGLAHVEQEKLILPPVIRSGAVPEVYDVPKNTVVYSGFYLTPKEGYSGEDIRAALRSEGLADYLKSSGQDMSGGYISYKASAIRDFRF